MNADDEDNEDLDLQTEGVITRYTQRALKGSRERLSPGNILRPIARTLGRLGAHLGVPIQYLLREVVSAYETLQEHVKGARPPAEAPKKRKPAKKAAQSVVRIQGGHYVLEVTQSIAMKLVDAGLIAACGGTHFHPNLPEESHPVEHERMRLRIQHFLEGLCN